jgi:biopolymer transport protein ExbB
MLKRLLILTAMLIINISIGAFAQNSQEQTNAVLDLGKVFRGSPMIYSTLLILSVFAFILWLYSLLTLKLSDMMPVNFIDKVQLQLQEQRFEAALKTCEEEPNFTSNILARGINVRKHGSQIILETIQSEGKRCATSLWQRVSLLNDVAVIAPMLGLLGTVLGMFYAFYDSNQTPESVAAIFDGLGIAIGTTVAGLIVAILAMVFQTTLKLHIIKLLGRIENQSLKLGNLIEPTTSTTTNS